uniref:Uncharacterized protein n=1 Tax=Trypanosoma congolense (strain IL3000) TaxID=1068625 RepID=G0UXN2_TRYCI|nr:conserved hypothetical protein [Trypanosoma congolense IL3000]
MCAFLSPYVTVLRSAGCPYPAPSEGAVWRKPEWSEEVHLTEFSVASQVFRMREKVVPIPFLGKEVSAWLYRTTRWVKQHPYRTCGLVLTSAVGCVLYEVNVTHKDRIPSPNVRNHLEYSLRREVDSAAQGDCESEENLSAQEASLINHISRLEALLSVTEDEAQRGELQRVIDLEKEKSVKYNNMTMKVTSGQLYVREPHWNIRNNERNWSILSRDHQQQKDHYWYRLERSRDDDFSRNTYMRNTS